MPNHHLILGLAGALGLAFLSAKPCMATDVPTDERVIDDARLLAAWADQEPPPYRRIAAEADRLAALVDAQARNAAPAAAASQPEFAGRIAERIQPPPAPPQAASLVALYHGTTVTEVQAAWLRQLRGGLRGAHGLLTAEPAAVREWMMAWIEASPGIDGFFRREHARDYLIEAGKLARLLAATPAAVRVEAGETLFEDSFAFPSQRWRNHGDGILAIGQGVMRVRGSGSAVVLDLAAADALISFLYTPVATGVAVGGGPGCLFAFPAAPLTAAGLAASAGPMADYNYGIDTYHVSLFRGSTKCSNLRRTGRGLRMLSHVEPDPCATLGRTYRVELLRLGATMQVFVDGRMIHAYLDGGAFGVPPASGSFCLRTFSGGEMELTLADFRISRPAVHY